MTFGYKYGLPIDADLVFDTRFLPNPHWVAGAASAAGHGRARCATTSSHRTRRRRISRGSRTCSTSLVPAFIREGKHYLTVGVGCTGGRHRSVVFGEEIGALPRASWATRRGVVHRDLDRE